MRSRITRSVALALLALLLASGCAVERLGERGGRSSAATKADPAAPLATAVADALGGAEAPAATATADGSKSVASGGSARGSKPVVGPGSAPAANMVTTAVERKASDRGVTPNEIVLGVLAAKEDTFEQFGVTYDGKRHEQVIKPFVDEINALGGINGRKLVTKVSRFDALSQDNMQSKCVEQAEDFKVFAAIAPIGYWGDAEVCMATKKTPLLTGNNSSADSNHRREQGWVRQTAMNKDRALRNWVDWLIATSQVTPQTRNGLLYTDVPEDRQIMNDVLVPYMKQKGLQVTEVAAFSYGDGETTSAESQASALRFKSSNVELVFPVTNFLQMFVWVTQADSIQYKPRYTVSDFGLMATDATSFYPASQWNGVTGVTVFRTGENQAGKLPTYKTFTDCAAVYAKHGEKIAPNPDDPSQPDGIETTNMLQYCEHINLFADAARRAGVNPTRQSYLEAVGNTGTWSHLVGLSERLTFTPNKYDGADMLAVVRWEAGCGGTNEDGGCFRQIRGFEPGTW